MSGTTTFLSFSREFSVNMMSDDSLTETDDSFFDLYSTQKVTSTYNSLLEKLKSANDETINQEETLNTLKDSKYNCSPLNEIGDENISEIIVTDDSATFTPPLEGIPVRRNARVNRNRRNKPVNAGSNRTNVNKRKKSKRLKGKKEAEVVELSDSELSEQACSTINTSLDDEFNYEVSVKVVWKSVSVKTFRLRRFQKLEKIFQYFMEEEQVPLEQILLNLKNMKICPNDTPDSLDLKVYDFIEGGILSESVNTSDKPLTNEKCHNKKDCLTVKVQDIAKKVFKFSIGKDECLKVIMVKYAEQIDTPLNKIKFYFDGEILNCSDKPVTLGMENDEIIDVKILE